MRSLKILSTVLAMMVLTGCEPELATDLYTSDLRAVASGEDGLITAATLSLPIGSLDGACEVKTGKIVAIMEGIVEPFAPKGCVKKDSERMLAALQIPMIDAFADFERTDALFGIRSRHNAEDNAIAVSILMDLEKFRILSERAEDEFNYTVDFDESIISFVLHNDERGDASFQVGFSFVQGAPVLTDTLSISQRKHIEIILSDVAAAYLGQYGRVFAFSLID